MRVVSLCAVAAAVLTIASERHFAETIYNSWPAREHMRQFAVLPSKVLLAAAMLAIFGPSAARGRLRLRYAVFVATSFLFCFYFGPIVRARQAWNAYTEEPATEHLAHLFNALANGFAGLVASFGCLSDTIGCWAGFRLWVSTAATGTVAIDLWLWQTDHSSTAFPPLQGSLEGSVAISLASILLCLWLTPRNRAWLHRGIITQCSGKLRARHFDDSSTAGRASSALPANDVYATRAYQSGSGTRGSASGLEEVATETALSEPLLVSVEAIPTRGNDGSARPARVKAYPVAPNTAQLLAKQR